MTAYRWHDLAPRTAAMQMALDRALADAARDQGWTVYRLYRWSEPTISFGANEAAVRTWDREALDAASVEQVRRPTGGRGVWHDPADLTYAVTAPRAAMGGLRLAYRVIHDQLASALRRLGLDAGVTPLGARPTLQPGACFDAAVGGEVLVLGRKTIGSAQAVFGTALLQHGAIALADRQRTLARFRLTSTPPERAQPPLDALPADAVASAILEQWRDAGALPFPEVMARAAQDAAASWAAHFDDMTWTWRR